MTAHALVTRQMPLRDMDAANAPAQMLASFEYETVLSAHGEPVLQSGRDTIADLVIG